MLFAADSGWRLRMDGFGPIKMGMTQQQVHGVVGVSVVEETISPDEGCWYLLGQKHLKGVSFMIIDGRVSRIEVDTPQFLTLNGAGVGTTEEQLKQLYGSHLQMDPHKYLDDSGHYLTQRSSDGLYGVRFETKDKTVFRFYAGPWEHLRYVEGCL